MFEIVEGSKPPLAVVHVNKRITLDVLYQAMADAGISNLIGCSNANKLKLLTADASSKFEFRYRESLTGKSAKTYPALLKAVLSLTEDGELQKFLHTLQPPPIPPAPPIDAAFVRIICDLAAIKVTTDDLISQMHALTEKVHVLTERVDIALSKLPAQRNAMPSPAVELTPLMVDAKVGTKKKQHKSGSSS